MKKLQADISPALTPMTKKFADTPNSTPIIFIRYLWTLWYQWVNPSIMRLSKSLCIPATAEKPLSNTELAEICDAIWLDLFHVSVIPQIFALPWVPVWSPSSLGKSGLTSPAVSTSLSAGPAPGRPVDSGYHAVVNDYWSAWARCGWASYGLYVVVGPLFVLVCYVRDARFHFFIYPSTDPSVNDGSPFCGGNQTRTITWMTTPWRL